MGLFSRKKKVAPAPAPLNRSIPSPASPCLSVKTSFSSCLPSPVTVPETPVEPPLSLNVLLDSAHVYEPFIIEVSKEDDMKEVRRKLATVIGNASMSLFKVNIPTDALGQARTYTSRYNLPVNFITSFSAFNLDSSNDHIASLGQITSLTPRDTDSNLRVKDWWRSQPSNDEVNLLVRTTPGPVTSVPITFLTHVALPVPASPVHLRATSPPASPGGKAARLPPTVLEVLPDATIDELKSAVLKADSYWNGGSDQVDKSKMVLWKVEMSEEEMIVIEERGGLKCGQMPWPYPPTAPVPIALDDPSLPVSHYFPSHRSNSHMINLSAWIHPSADSLRAQTPICPRFKYPMVFPDPFSPTSGVSPSSSIVSGVTIRPHHSMSFSTPMIEPSAKLNSTSINPDPFAYRTKSRGRPSTAPAVVGSSHSTDNCQPVAPPTFGAGSRRKAPPSRLNTSHIPAYVPKVAKGLGIEMSPSPTQSDFSSPPPSSRPTPGFNQLQFQIAPLHSPDLTRLSTISSIKPSPLASTTESEPSEDMSSTKSLTSNPSFTSDRIPAQISRGSVSSISSTGSAVSFSDEDELPALVFSNLRFDSDISIISTPDKSNFEQVRESESEQVVTASLKRDKQQRSDNISTIPIPILKSSISDSTSGSGSGPGSELTTPTTERNDWLVWSPAPSINTTKSTSGFNHAIGTATNGNGYENSNNWKNGKLDQGFVVSQVKYDEFGLGLRRANADPVRLM